MFRVVSVKVIDSNKMMTSGSKLVQVIFVSISLSSCPQLAHLCSQVCTCYHKYVKRVAPEIGHSCVDENKKSWTQMRQKGMKVLSKKNIGSEPNYKFFPWLIPLH